jgi:hypothetical protein
MRPLEGPERRDPHTRTRTPARLNSETRTSGSPGQPSTPNAADIIARVSARVADDTILSYKQRGEGPDDHLAASSASTSSSRDQSKSTGPCAYL